MSSAEVDELLRRFGIEPQPPIDAVRELIWQHRRGLHGKKASEGFVHRFLTYLADCFRVTAEAVVRLLLWGPRRPCFRSTRERQANDMAFDCTIVLHGASYVSEAD